ncbi:MAG: hypothetical protein K0U79_11785 [Gammaproteobacteria bacterium]|nr:hypothetical protein [Gammaproteobacteria bacterium]
MPEFRIRSTQAVRLVAVVLCSCGASFAVHAEGAQEARTWGLPWLAGTAESRGVNLPRPLGVGAMAVHYREDLTLDELVLSADTGQRGGVDFIDIDNAEITTEILQLRFDAWLFPFMNVFAMVGLADNDVSADYSFQGDDLIAFLGDESRCAPDASPRPAACDMTFTGEIGQKPEGASYSLGTLLAVGRGSYFALAGISYTWNDVDTVDDSIETLAVSPRFGRRFEVNGGEVAVYAGGLYLDSDVQLSKQLTFAAPDGDIEVTITTYEQNAKRWSYVAGASWDVSRDWNIQGEVGYGSSREGVLASVTRRF